MAHVVPVSTIGCCACICPVHAHAVLITQLPRTSFEAHHPCHTLGLKHVDKVESHGVECLPHTTSSIPPTVESKMPSHTHPRAHVNLSIGLAPLRGYHVGVGLLLTPRQGSPGSCLPRRPMFHYLFVADGSSGGSGMSPRARSG